MKRLILLGLVVLGALPVAVRAQSAELAPVAEKLAANGGEVVLHLSIRYPEAPAALGFRLNLPAGWAFARLEGAFPPDIKSPKGATGAIELAWLAAPAGPVELALHVTYPAGAKGTALKGEALLRVGDAQTGLPVEVTLSR